ncbi:MAG: hypothetical protein FVQ77_11455 [Cytophagales bacterium]|nr:hypothetical protein [Cytophagales bacterium]
MKKLTLTFATALICVIFLNLCFAQDTKDSVVSGNYKNEIGILIWRSSPWLISYKRYVKANKAIRMGIGGAINNFDLSVTSTGNYKDPGLSKRFGSNSRLGFEWHKNILQRLDFYYGIDLTFSYSYGSTKSEYYRDPSIIIKRSDKYIYITGGLAPVAGLEFTLNSRISFSTEVLPMALFYYRLRETIYSDPDYVNRIEKTTGISFKLYSAGAIYLNLHF